MKPLSWFLVGSGGLVWCASACAHNPETRVRDDVKVVQEERTPDKLFKRGKAFAAVGDFTRAEQYFAAALREGGEPKKILPLLLRVCVESGRYRVAIDHANTYLRSHPDDHELRYLLGTLYTAIDEPAAARSHLERVISARPDDPRSHYALGVLFRDNENDLVKADYHFRQYLRLSPTGPYAEEARGSLLKSVP